jgi:hypothetical protein
MLLQILIVTQGHLAPCLPLVSVVVVDPEAGEGDGVVNKAGAVVVGPQEDNVVAEVGKGSQEVVDRPGGGGRGRRRAAPAPPPAPFGPAGRVPNVQPFTVNDVGPCGDALTLDGDPLDHFFLFFTDELLQTIVDETNRYATQYFRDHPGPLSPNSRLKSWSPITLDELKKLLGVLMLTGIVKKPELTDY